MSLGGRNVAGLAFWGALIAGGLIALIFLSFMFLLIGPNLGFLLILAFVMIAFLVYGAVVYFAISFFFGLPLRRAQSIAIPRRLNGRGGR